MIRNIFKSPNDSQSMVPDLYSRLKANPTEIVQVESHLACNIARGWRFTLEPLHILEIPDRKQLAARMYDTYGIQGIDSYFVPVVTDTLTYRTVDGNYEPDIWSGIDSFIRTTTMRKGHVRAEGNFYIAYISANLPIDEEIEHEAIHAFLFHQNPHYTPLAPRFGDTWIKIPQDKDRSWIEAVSYVATQEKTDVESVIQSYVAIPAKKQGALRALRSYGLLPLTFAAGCAAQSFFTAKEHRLGDIPYALLHHALGHVHLAQTRHLSRIDAEAEWRTSFSLAHRLKSEFGVKSFLRAAGMNTRDELSRMFS
jgi:hypothetical protein